MTIHVQCRFRVRQRRLQSFRNVRVLSAMTKLLSRFPMCRSFSKSSDYPNSLAKPRKVPSLKSRQERITQQFTNSWASWIPQLPSLPCILFLSNRLRYHAKAGKSNERAKSNRRTSSDSTTLHLMESLPKSHTATSHRLSCSRPRVRCSRCQYPVIETHNQNWRVK